MNRPDPDRASAPPMQRGESFDARLLDLIPGERVRVIDHHTLGIRRPEIGLDGLFARQVLQDMQDYRGAITGWFEQVREGGVLGIEVPHTHLHEKALALPVEGHPERCRLYTPSSLLGEIEESLEPNSYRVRLLCDIDEGFDYATGRPGDRGAAILIALERLPVPSWSPETGELKHAAPPPFEFEARGTRVETASTIPIKKVLILKLDHLGDFIIGLTALELARSRFADAEITLVVGSWNAAMARKGTYADRIIAFDAFPRNPTEEKIDLSSRLASFAEAVPEQYDLAIDLRTDADTRPFLERAKASVRAAIGARRQYPYLDIALPVDDTRAWEKAASDPIAHDLHICLPPARKTANRIVCEPETSEPGQELPQVLMWGPYVHLQPGDYIYEPLLEIEDEGQERLLLDIALETETVAQAVAVRDRVPKMHFSVREPGRFEFRIFRVGEKVPPFSFFGGTMRRRAADSVLHQSEYLVLLVHLTAMRCQRFGLLQDRRATA